MGFAKDRLTRQELQGWTFVDDAFACDECVEEPFLKEWIECSASEHACTYCDRSSREVPLAVPVNDLFAFMNEGLSAEYDEANNWYPYDSEDKTLVGIWSDSYELAEDLALFNSEKLYFEFTDSFDGRMFCPRDPYGLSESQEFISGWRHFVAHVKHQSRYYFPTEPADETGGGPGSGNGMSVSETPAYVGEAVRTLGLIREIGTDQTFYRARLSLHGNTFGSAQEIGTAPLEHATAANRMSPAGIPMFYASDNESTAIAEVYEESRDPSGTAKASVAAFKPSRPLRLIDLTGQNPLPSLFDESVRPLREKVRLLEDFGRAIAEPIRKDGQEHIEYVPTQIVTEYFRRVFSAEEGMMPIDGIMYQSSRKRGRVCYVLFVDNEHCLDGETSLEDDELYLLLPAGAVSIRGPATVPVDCEGIAL